MTEHRACNVGGGGRRETERGKNGEGGGQLIPPTRRRLFPNDRELVSLPGGGVEPVWTACQIHNILGYKDCRFNDCSFKPFLAAAEGSRLVGERSADGRCSVGSSSQRAPTITHITGPPTGPFSAAFLHEFIPVRTPRRSALIYNTEGRSVAHICVWSLRSSGNTAADSLPGWVEARQRRQ